MKIETILRLADAVYGPGCDVAFGRDSEGEDVNRMILVITRDGRLKKRHVAATMSITSDTLLLIVANELRATLEGIVKTKQDELREAIELFEQVSKEEE